jgi:hypothetical protein
MMANRAAGAGSGGTDARLRGILELLPSRVENQPCAPEGVLSGMVSRLTRAVTDRRKVVARRPDARGEFLPEQITFGGEPLEGNFVVAVKFVAHDVESVEAGSREPFVAGAVGAIKSATI